MRLSKAIHETCSCQHRLLATKKIKVLERQRFCASSLCSFLQVVRLCKKNIKVLERQRFCASSLRSFLQVVRLWKKIQSFRATTPFDVAAPDLYFFSLDSQKKFKVLEQRCLSATSLQCPLRFFKHQGQIVDQRLTLNESQRKTALTITTPRSSTRSFANDLAPRLSTRGLTPTRDDACRVPEGQRVDSVTARRPSSFVCRGRGTNASSLLGGILT